MSITKERIQAAHQQVSNALEDGVIPFWLERSLDKDFGGFLTNFDEKGQDLGTPEKYLNTQCRLIWWFSTLTRHYPHKKAYRQMAQQGMDFLLRHFWDARHGGWFWKTRRDGAKLDDGKSVYGQSFAIYATAEYYRATRDHRVLEYANRTFDLLQIYCADTLRGGYFENLEREWQVSDPGFYGGDRKGLDTHMHLMEAFTSLYAASGLQIHRAKLGAQVELILRHLINPETGCGRNQVDLDFNPIPAIALNRTWNAERAGETPAVPTDTTSYGHNVELSWLMNLAIQTGDLPLEPYKPAMKRLLDHALQHGVDWECGGIYRDGIADGKAIIKEKEFWQNAEVLVGFLDGYESFCNDRYFDAFENVWEFVNTHMINHAIGEFRTLLDRKGQPIDANIGNPWKVAYHTGRALLECSTRLARLSQAA
ncbi:MAG: AGE family epimerase/isomerase [Anaerolineales bacterium]|uniref:AGE family epimerase/isomerase n=1 Tax=Candidatus Desulfolinea nitratireducens TaxID=2841698 RepID=A0A8J6NJ79_9CHLR|nr:AGE family epimerase/isomerase [Candidatus Desulfolinea nitratireducens]